MVKMFNVEGQRFEIVDEMFVCDLEAKGYTTILPTDEQINELIASERNGVKKKYDPVLGVVEA